MRTVMIPILLLGLSTPALAADATLDRARRCAEVKDSLERLVCYDTLFASQPVLQPAPSATVVPAVPPAGAAAVVPTPAPAVQTPPTARVPAPAGVTPSAVTPAAPAASPAPVTAPSPATGAVADADFGGEMVKRTVEERAESAGPKTISAAVQALRETRPDVFRITLDNGQIWQQMDKDGLFHVSVGDTVQIDRGALGGYRMARTSNGRSGWVRVNRLK